MNNKKVILSLLLVLFIGTIAMANNMLYIAEDAPFYFDRDNEIAGFLLEGTEVSVVQEEGNWVKLQLEVWVPENYITAEYEKTVEETGIRIRQGFIYDNIRFRGQLDMTEIIGEMTNDSGQNYSLINFMVSVYDKDSNLLATGYINISDFADGETKSFSGLIDIDFNKIAKYRIQYDSGF